MPTYNVNVLPIARDDIAEIYSYIVQDNPKAALRITNEILDKVETLSEFPNRCPIVPDKLLAQQGFRMLIIGNYLAFFKVYRSEVIVFRVLHGKRNYPQLLLDIPDEE